MTDMIDKLTMSFPDLLRHNKSYRNAALLLVVLSLGLVGICVGVGEIFPFAQKGHEILMGVAQKQGIPQNVVTIVWILIKGLIFMHILLLAPLFLVWWERKVAAHIQSRYGPMRVGWHGWLQMIADGVKLVLKEDVVPAAADPLLHRLAPIVVFLPAFLSYAVLPFGKDLAAVDLDIGVLYVMAVSGLSIFGIIMAGWSSGNKFSLLGGLRAAAQLVSFELPRSVSIVPIIMFAGSLSLVKISDAQAGLWFGFLPRWYIFAFPIGPIAFLIFLIASIAETNRTPFDLPEAESELVAGFLTEYSGIKFSLLMLGEIGYTLLASALASILFLGGWNPLPGLGFIPSWAWLAGKTLSVVFLFLWVRWTFPRFRVDRMMDFNWKFLFPWALANVALAGVVLALKG